MVVLVLVQGGYVFNPILERLNLFDPATCQQATRSNFAVNIWCNLQSVTELTPGPSGVPNNVLLNGALKVDGLLMMSRLVFIGAALLTSLMIRDYGSAANPAEFFGLLLFATIGMGLMHGRQRDDRGVSGARACRRCRCTSAGYFKGDLRSSEAGIKYYIFGALS